MSSSTAARRGGGGPISILFCDPLELAVEVGLFFRVFSITMFSPWSLSGVSRSTSASNVKDRR
eukprot:137998-Heterocapsa_arctica.AAC.1